MKIASRGLHGIALILLILLSLPLLALVGKVLLSAGGSWRLGETAVYVQNTFYYIGGVAAVCLLIALPLGWLTTVCEFRGRQWAVWLLIAPFAFPPYLMAFTYAQLADEVRGTLYGLPAAVLTTALALFPYVYFMVRLAWRWQHCQLHSAARLLERSRWLIFWRVSLPMMRPAVTVGVMLVVMESMNDVAVAEYFGVPTMGLAIYDWWLNYGDAAAAIRLSLLLMLVMLGVVLLERQGRARHKQFVESCDRCFDCERRVRLAGWQPWAAWAAVLTVSGAGFLLPFGYLLWLSANTPPDWAMVAAGLGDSLMLCFFILALSAVVGGVLTVERRVNKKAFLTAGLAGVVGIMYALPGIVIAQGIFILSGAVGLGLGFIALGLAFLSRFYIIVAANLQAGVDKISPQIEGAMRLAAVHGWRQFFYVYLPMMRAGLAVGGVLIFLETWKELSMTLALRPLGFEPLPILVYQYASDEALPQAAGLAVMLVLGAVVAISTLFYLEGRDSRGQ